MRIKFFKNGWIEVTASCNGQHITPMYFEDFRWPMVRDNVLHNIIVWTHNARKGA